jgi:hypothetical protein
MWASMKRPPWPIKWALTRPKRKTILTISRPLPNTTADTRNYTSTPLPAKMEKVIVFLFAIKMGVPILDSFFGKFRFSFILESNEFF